MHIDSIQPVENIFAGSDPRHVFSTQGQSSPLPQPAVKQQSSGNTVGVEETKQALGELARAFERFNVSLKFSKDTETGTIVIEMIDQTSGETLQQIPNKASLHIAATLSKLQGKFFSCKT